MFFRWMALFEIFKEGPLEVNAFDYDVHMHLLIIQRPYSLSYPPSLVLMLVHNMRSKFSY